MNKRIKAVGIITIMALMLSACGTSGIKSKWYMVNDDDYWMDIGDSEIRFYSVHTDELVAKADVSVSGNEMVVSNLNKLNSSAFSLSEGRYTFEMNGNELKLVLDGKYEELFNTDEKYKRDH